MKISIFGLGHVGLVSAACFASLGHSVTGVDAEAKTRSLVALGRSPFVEPGLQDLLHDAVSKGRLTVSDDARAVVRATELSLVCVGTPTGLAGTFDAEALAEVSRAIGSALGGKHHTVVIRSTVLPGTVREIVIPTLAKANGIRAGADFDVAVAPEFLREGTAVEDFFTPAQIVVGADSRDVASRVVSLFRGVAGRISMTSIESAEMVKYASNVWHGLKIAFANEIGAYCQSLAIDAAEVMRIFAEDRKLNLSTRYLTPGFAFGGPCLVKDLQALTAHACKLGLDLPLLSSILRSNERRIEERLELILRSGKQEVSFLGLSHKPDTDDLRSSPYLDLCLRLVAHGLDLRVFDPILTRSGPGSGTGDHFPRVSPLPTELIVATLDEALLHGDLIVIGTPHRAFLGIRHQLRPGQSLIDLASGTLESLYRPPGLGA